MLSYIGLEIVKGLMDFTRLPINFELNYVVVKQTFPSNVCFFFGKQVIFAFNAGKRKKIDYRRNLRGLNNDKHTTTFRLLINPSILDFD